MIPHLSEEDKNDWHKRIKRNLRRQKNKATYKVIREIVYMACVVVFVTASIRACNEVTWKPKPSDFTADSLYVDSVIGATEAETKRVTDSFQRAWNMDSIAEYIYKMGRCRQLEDSEKGVYILYAQGSRTYEDYQRAHRIYRRYFKKVYQPALDRLNAHTK